MKRFCFLLTILISCVTMVGCVSSDGGNKKIASEYEKFKQSLPPAQWVPVGYKSIDDIGILSAQLYAETYKYLQEYIQATENNRSYIGLMNEVEAIKKNEGVDDKVALQKAINNIAEADKNRPEGTEPVLPKVIAGYNAVQALKPSNKLISLLPMLVKVAEIILQADRLNADLKSACDNPFQLIQLGKSVVNVTKQLYYTQKLGQYIKIQYERNIEMKQYMQQN